MFRTICLLLALLLLPLATLGCSTQADSPQGAVEVMIEGMKANDAQAFYSSLSASSIKTFAAVQRMALQSEEYSSEKGVTPEEAEALGDLELLVEIGLDDEALSEMDFEKDVEYSNEQINGDKGSVDATAEGAATNTIQCVKEDGVWKVDLFGSVSG